MRDLLILAVHLLVTVAKLLRPGGVRAVAAESLLLKHQLIVSSRARRRAPNLTSLDLEVIAAIIEMKIRNPKFGYLRIAQQISHAFGIEIDKHVVRRVLAKHYRPDHSDSNGPSWLSFLAQTKDSLWSLDLFRCESILLRSHWVMLVMDVFTRRIVGFGVERAYLDGVSVCRMFNHAFAGQPLPKHVSTDHDPLFRFHRWLANLRVLEIEETKSVPYVPISHPFMLAHPCPPRLSSLRTPGNRIVEVFFRLPLPLDQEFAPNSRRT